jgi:hypothetical protein
MKNLIKIIGIIFLIVIADIGIFKLISWGSSANNRIIKGIIPKRDSFLEISNLAEFYCDQYNLNEDFCILIDMSLHSGKKRFFIFNLKTKEIEKSYLVSHGCGNNPHTLDHSKTNPQFSNTEDSHLSSLGKYKIGESGWSGFGVGKKYRLHGLDESNSNAYNRNIVFHSWSNMPDEEVYPNGSPEGWGCPAVSNNAFLEIDSLLKDVNKPVLMWIYEN